MKRIIQQVLINSVALYLTSSFLEGLRIKGGLDVILIGGIILTIGFMIVKPVLETVSLPFNIISFGLFSALITVLIMFLVTKLYSPIQVVSFTFPGLSLFGITIKSFAANTILSYIMVSAIIYFTNKILTWVFEN